MDYALIIVLQFIGIGFHVMQKVISLGTQFPQDGPSVVFRAFLKEDWDTLMVSGLVVLLNVVTHYILETYAPGVTQIENYALYSFGVAFVLGYAGQRIVYKYLGTAEKLLDKKADDLNNRLGGK